MHLYKFKLKSTIEAIYTLYTAIVTLLRYYVIVNRPEEFKLFTKTKWSEIKKFRAFGRPASGNGPFRIN